MCTARYAHCMCTAQYAHYNYVHCSISLLLDMFIVYVLLDMLIVGVLFEMLIVSMLLPLYGCVCVYLLLNVGEIGCSEAAWPGRLTMMLVT